MAMSIRESLERNRDGYDAEGVWQRFLLDSYTGNGGYMGRVKQPPSGYWGSAAQAYSNFSATYTFAPSDFAHAEDTSYLDRFPREDVDKFLRRKFVAHYLNYCAPITNLKISYIMRKPLVRQNPPDKLRKWLETSGYDKQFRTRAIAAAVLGWWPCLVDKPSVPANALTLADARQKAGNLDPYVVMMLPCHLRDYELDDQGAFVWAKMAQTITVKKEWTSEPVKLTRYTVWTRHDFVVYEQLEGGEPTKTGGGPHSFGKVPLVSWRADTDIEDKVKATSQIADIALEGRRLFNLISELDEHIRSQVFAILIYPQRQDSSANGGTVDVGNKNGLQVDTEQKNMPTYLAPPATVASTLETRVEKSVIEIYRMARVEYDRASGTNSSAQSKQQNFEQTNAALVDFATALARADHETLYLVGTALGCTPEELDKMEVNAAQSYATEDLSLELQQVIDAITELPMLGRQAKIEMLTRLVQQLIPDMSEDTKKTINSEIEEAVDQADKQAELLREAALTPPDDATGSGAAGDGSAGDKAAKQPRLATASDDNETAPNSALT
jgi:hypothetical protein